jgi:hypothetical protein
MISSISLQNFRGFRDSGLINLARLTFLVGPNSSGKSTVANAVMFVAQSFNTRDVTRLSPDWMGRLVDLGSFEDTVYRHKMKNAMSIEIGVKLPLFERASEFLPSDHKPETLWRWEIRQTSTKSEGTPFLSGKVASLTIKDPISDAEVNISSTASHHLIKLNGEEIKVRTDSSLIGGHWVIAQSLKYVIDKPPVKLKASKAGYRRLLEAYASNTTARLLGGLERVSSARSGPKRWVAKENSSVASSSSSSLLNDPYTISLAAGQSRVKRASSETISKHLNELNIASSLDRVDLSAYHTALKVTDNLTNVRSNLADVGFGASQVIPVIRGCIDANFGPLVIEQPEIHLHPKAQTQLASLICESSLRRQIFVETHSEHMINKARILVAEKKLKPEDVTIVYVDKSRNGSHVIQIGIDQNGDFTRPWPEGFFDERYHDSMKLLSLKSKTASAVEINAPKKRTVKARIA